jgi:hypothetical protein
MLKTFLISIGYIFVITALCINAAFAEDTNCENKYCISVDVENSQMSNNSNPNFDLCFVLQINASDHFINGSISMQQLPAVLFSISKNNELSGKPLSFRIIKAQIVPSGQCNSSQSSLEPVAQCEIFDYAAMHGVSRSIDLIKNKYKSGFTCNIDSTR